MYVHNESVIYTHTHTHTHTSMHTLDSKHQKAISKVYDVYAYIF